MIYKKISLDDRDKNAYLEVYVADKIQNFVRKAILVIPGGGYSSVCSDREGEPIAMAFIPYGYNAFVLHYSVGENVTFPKQLIQASKAIKHIKDNAEEYNINPEHVFAVGFSAGGHLAGSLGILWDNPEVYKELDMEYGYNKPTGIMLIYPVVSSANESFKQKETFFNLLKTETPSHEEILSCSLELNVSQNVAPAYILHTANDEIVNVRNSLSLADAYSVAKVPYELHIYPDGPHGVALGNRITKIGVEKYEEPAIAKWVENAVYWANKICD